MPQAFDDGGAACPESTLEQHEYISFFEIQRMRRAVHVVMCDALFPAVSA